MIYHPTCQLPEMLLVPNGLSNAFSLYIKHCKATTHDSVYFCNSSCYSASEEVTFAIAISTQPDIEVSSFEIGERISTPIVAHISNTPTRNKKDKGSNSVHH